MAKPTDRFAIELVPGQVVQVETNGTWFTGHVSSVEEPGVISKLSDREMLARKDPAHVPTGKVSVVFEIIVPYIARMPAANLIAAKAEIPCPWLDTRRLDVFPAYQLAEFIADQCNRDPQGFTEGSPRDPDSKRSFETWLALKIGEFYKQHFKEAGIAPPALVQ